MQTTTRNTLYLHAVVIRRNINPMHGRFKLLQPTNTRIISVINNISILMKTMTII